MSIKNEIRRPQGPIRWDVPPRNYSGLQTSDSLVDTKVWNSIGSLVETGMNISDVALRVSVEVVRK